MYETQTVIVRLSHPTPQIDLDFAGQPGALSHKVGLAVGMYEAQGWHILDIDYRDDRAIIQMQQAAMSVAQ
ncbi:MAG: hypothetical protein ACLFTK_13790 [Anaerolineales bacterium]